MNLQENIDLAPYTTWKIGRKARYFVGVKNVEEVKDAVDFSQSKSLPFFILGGGSNILVSDQGFNGLVIKMELQEIIFSESGVTAGAGVMMSRLAAETLQNGFSGLEWAVGLPGTVGGAIFGNSNCWGGSTGKSLLKAKLLSNSETSPNPSLARRGMAIKEVGRDYFNFSYDYSTLQKTQEILLEATFSIKKLNEEQAIKARQELSNVAAERVARQPLGKKVAGSTFKALVPTREVIDKFVSRGINYKQGLRDGYISAGWIIDKILNLKGFEMGNMKISDLHANFFVNLGSASSQEAKNLIDFVKKECKNKLDIDLEEEIRYVGEF